MSVLLHEQQVGRSAALPHLGGRVCPCRGETVLVLRTSQRFLLCRPGFSGFLSMNRQTNVPELGSPTSSTFHSLSWRSGWSGLSHLGSPAPFVLAVSGPLPGVLLKGPGVLILVLVQQADIAGSARGTEYSLGSWPHPPAGQGLPAEPRPRVLTLWSLFTC